MLEVKNLQSEYEKLQKERRTERKIEKEGLFLKERVKALGYEVHILTGLNSTLTNELTQLNAKLCNSRMQTKGMLGMLR